MNPERWERLKQIFHAALEQEPGARAEYLREACAGDESLRGEVETLLARDAEATDFLKSPALEVEARALAGDLADEGRSPDAGPHVPVPPIGTSSPGRGRPVRPPWWMFALAALFLCDWLLRAYCIVLGPARFDFGSRWDGGRLVVASVQPGTASEGAGLRPGDVVTAIDGQAIRSRSDSRAIYPNLEAGRTYRLEIDRGGRRALVAYPIERARSFDRWITTLWQVNGLLLLLTAFVIAFHRPRDRLARLGAFALATVSASLVTWAGFPTGCAAIWRSLPTAFAALLWLPPVCSYLVGPILLTFFVYFPRPLVRLRWWWAAIWFPAVCFVPAYLHDALLVVYRPPQAYGNLMPDGIFFLGVRLYGLYALLSLAALTANYLRLTDLNDRRRLRVLLIGGTAAVLPGAFRLLIWRSVSLDGLFGWLSTAAPDLVIAALFVLLPASFAYAILRHRLLDVRLIIRQGVQYAAARGVLLSAVPILGVVLVADLLAHGDQPLIRILEARGWVYAALGSAAAAAHSQRRRWGEAIDRRFFREHYDAHRLLRETAVQIGRARSIAEAASSVVTRVEAALHPEFAAIVHRPEADDSFQTLAVSPPDKAPPRIPAGSGLISAMRTSKDSREVLLGDTGWLQDRLPDREVECLRRARIDLIVPIAMAPAQHEALLVLGVKRSEEPYTRDDRDMLSAIASNLELLLERPELPPARPRDGFEECPTCGTCYDTGAGRCPKEGAQLAAVHASRVVAHRYRLERRLDSGGMGAVYEAADGMLGRRVAVKVIREDRIGSPGAAQRFQREARAAAGFLHLNVVTVHDCGIDEGTRAFLVMELLEGRTLRAELRVRQRLDAERLLGVFRGLCSAVEAAHLRGLIHRDLKPENVFLASRGEGEIVKVLDFGIAKFLPGCEEPGDAPNLGETDAGVLVGTPGYISPEQLLGEEPGVSWDLWALAVTAYEALTGALPFATAGGDGWRRSVLAGRHARLAEHLSDPPASWEDFFARSLAADRTTRPGSAREFLLDLERALRPHDPRPHS